MRNLEFDIELGHEGQEDAPVRSTLQAIERLIRSINKLSQSTDNFTASIVQLDTDVKSLIAQGGSVGAAAAVDAFAVSAKASVDAIDAEVKAALNPQPPPTALVFTPAEVSMAVGANLQLNVKDPSGKDVTATATYTVSDGTIASISASGLVSAAKAGSTSGSAQDGVNSGSFKITVA